MSLAGIRTVHAEDFTTKNSVKGFGYKELANYKRNCTECVRVAQDIIALRQKECGQSLTVDDVIVKDAMFGYLNSLRNILDQQTYTKVLRVAGQDKDCYNSLNWTVLIHKYLDE